MAVRCDDKRVWSLTLANEVVPVEVEASPGQILLDVNRMKYPLTYTEALDLAYCLIVAVEHSKSRE